MNSNLLNNQVTGLATLPLLRKAKLKVAPLELPFVSFRDIFRHSILAFFLTFYSDIHFWHSIWHLFWHSFRHLFWHSFWHSIWYIFGESLWWRSGGEHSDRGGGGPTGGELLIHPQKNWEFHQTRDWPGNPCKPHDLSSKTCDLSSKNCWLPAIDGDATWCNHEQPGKHKGKPCPIYWYTWYPPFQETCRISIKRFLKPQHRSKIHTSHVYHGSCIYTLCVFIYIFISCKIYGTSIKFHGFTYRPYP